MAQDYFSGQGKVFLAPIVKGKAGNYRWVGDAPDFSPQFDVSKKEIKENWSGKRLTAITIENEIKSKLTATLQEWTRENLIAATRGTGAAVAAGKVAPAQAIESPAVIEPGFTWALPHRNVSNLVLKDSAAVSATVKETDFILDKDFGTITPVYLSTYTLPLKASYDFGATNIVSFFTSDANEFAVRFEGINTINGKKVLVELYRVKFDPTKELAMITDDLAPFKLDGNILVDSSKPEDPAFGRFGRIEFLG